MALILGGSPRREESSPPQYAKAPQLIVPVTPYDTRLPGFYSDTLFAVNPNDELQVLQDGGVMTLYDFTGLDPAHLAEGNLAGLVPCELSPGRNAVRPGSGDYGYLAYDVHGVLPVDEWTMQFVIRSNGADLTALAGTKLLGAVVAGHQSLLISATTTTLKARLAVNTLSFLIPGANDTMDADIPIVAGDAPADTWRAITISYDSIYGLSMVLGGDSPPSEFFTVIMGTSGLISGWSFDSASGPEPDQYGPGLDGTYAGGSVTKGVPGAIRGNADPAARFPGTSGGGYLDVGNNAALQLSTGTIEGWIKLGVQPPGSYAFSIARKNNAFSLILVDNIIKSDDFSTSGAIEGTGGAGVLTVGKYHHLGLTFQSGVVNGTKIIQDGVLVATGTMTVVNQSSPLRFGEPKTSYPTVDAQIALDEWNIYSTILTLADMKARFAFGPPKSVATETTIDGLHIWGAAPGVGTGLIPLAAAGLPPGNQLVDSTVPVIYRYSRYKRRQEQSDTGDLFAFADAPKVSVDPSVVTGDWTPGIAGVVDHDSSYTESGAMTATSDAQWALLADAGVTLIRVAQNHALAPITALNGASPPTINWTAFDAWYGRIKASADPMVHGMVGFVPTLLQTGGNPYAPPTSNTTYAQWASAVVGRLINTLDINLVSMSFWNEPQAQWTGNLAQFKALWLACAQQIAADNPTAPILGGPDAVEADANVNTTPNYTMGIVDQAEASGIDLGGVYIHNYQKDLTSGLEFIDSLKSYVDGKFTPECPVRMTEWAVRGALVRPGGGTNLFGAGGVGYALEGSVEIHVRNLYEAAHAYAFMWEAMELGVDIAAFFTMASHAPQYPGLMSGILDDTTGQPRPFPVFWAFALMWKHSGQRVQAITGWPNLRSICTVADDDTITLTYGSFKRSKGLHPDKQRFAIEWANLPATFAWKQWQLDESTPDLARLLPIATGNQDNLPLGVSIGNLGVGCVQITP